jgi:hypothetical protein
MLNKKRPILNKEKGYRIGMRKTSYLFLAGIFFFGVTNSARSDNSFTARVNTKYAYDDNIFRLPDDDPTYQIIHSDSSWSNELVFGIDRTYSRQRFKILSSIEKVKFNRYQNLDHVGHDLDAKWIWQIGNRLTGELDIRETLQLPPYTDVNTIQRNMKKARSSYVSATWQFYPDFNINTNYRQFRYQYELLSQQYNNHDEKYREIGIEYKRLSGSSIGLQARALEATNFPQPGATSSIDKESYTQNDLKLQINWYATALTNINAVVGKTSRRHRSAQIGKNSGPIGRINVVHTRGAKLKLNSSVWQEFAPLEGSQATYSLNRGLNVGAAWEITSKSQITGDLTFERRSYAPRISGSSPGDIHDYTRTAHIALTWVPRRSLSIVAEVSHQNRSGTINFSKSRFDTNSLSLAANFAFK